MKIYVLQALKSSLFRKLSKHLKDSTLNISNQIILHSEWSNFVTFQTTCPMGNSGKPRTYITITAKYSNPCLSKQCMIGIAGIAGITLSVLIGTVLLSLAFYKSMKYLLRWYNNKILTYLILLAEWRKDSYPWMILIL